MPVLNDIGKKISQTSQDAVKKTKDMLETGRLNTQIGAEKKKIAVLQQQIGQRYFELHAENPDEPFALLCSDILEAGRKIAEMQTEINTLKGIAACPSCGFENAIGANFCSACGAGMAKKEKTGDIVQ